MMNEIYAYVNYTHAYMYVFIQNTRAKGEPSFSIMFKGTPKRKKIFSI